MEDGRGDRLKAIYLKVLMDGYKSLGDSYKTDIMTPGYLELYALLRSDEEVSCICFEFDDHKEVFDTLKVIKENYYVMFISNFNEWKGALENTMLMTEYFDEKHGSEINLWWPVESIQQPGCLHLFEFTKRV